MSLEVDATTDVHVFPPVLARNLISGQAGTAAARAHLGALAELSPRTADGVAVDLVMETLGLIRDGHTDPARLAGDVFRVCSAAGGRWTR